MEHFLYNVSRIVLLNSLRFINHSLPEEGTMALFCSQNTELLESKNRLYLWKSLDKLSVKLFIRDVINGYAGTKPKGRFCLKRLNITVHFSIVSFLPYSCPLAVWIWTLNVRKMSYILSISTSTFDSFSPFHVKSRGFLIIWADSVVGKY